MKLHNLPLASSLALAVVLGSLSATAAVSATKVLYEVTPLEAPGTAHRGSSINERGWVAGVTVRADGVRHATLWKGTEAIPLESLAGRDASSAVIWDGLNNSGMVVGISHTGQPDPLGESWSCAAFGVPAKCLGFAWKDGVFTPLPTFPGGNNGFAAGVNNSGQIVGWAENGIRDDSCNNTTQFLQFRAALWEVRGPNVSIKELPPLGDDKASAATSINERGDAVGISGDCDQAVGQFSARHSVLWRDGVPTRIPDFGGVSWNTPLAININNEVVGFANTVPGKDPIQVGFYWNENDGLKKVVPLAGNTISEAWDVNTHGVVVGFSAGGAPGTRALIWKKAYDPAADPNVLAAKDLNACLAPGYTGGRLITARSINDRGEITGQALDSTGKTIVYVARPVPVTSVPGSRPDGGC